MLLKWHVSARGAIANTTGVLNSVSAVGYLFQFAGRTVRRRSFGLDWRSSSADRRSRVPVELRKDELKKNLDAAFDNLTNPTTAVSGDLLFAGAHG
jgi:hypothetical protein